jgi:hypothetical protein
MIARWWRELEDAELVAGAGLRQGDRVPEGEGVGAGAVLDHGDAA